MTVAWMLYMFVGGVVAGAILVGLRDWWRSERGPRAVRRYGHERRFAVMQERFDMNREALRVMRAMQRDRNRRR